MNMRYTKIVFRNTLNIAALVAALIAAVATIGGDVMNNLLATNCQPGQFWCLVEMYILVIVGVIGGCLLIIFSVPVALDLIIALSKWMKRVIQNYFNRPFDVHSKMFRKGDEVFIEVKNREWFLDALKIYVRADLLYKGEVIQERIRWFRQFSFGNETASIQRRKVELLHFATIDDEKREFCVHLENSDLSFPFIFDGIRTFDLFVGGVSSASPVKSSRHIINRHISVNQYLEKNTAVVFRIGTQW